MSWAGLAGIGNGAFDLLVTSSQTQQLTGSIILLSALCLVLALLVCCAFAAGCLLGALLQGGEGAPQCAAAVVRQAGIGLGLGARRRLAGYQQ